MLDALLAARQAAQAAEAARQAIECRLARLELRLQELQLRDFHPARIVQDAQTDTATLAAQRCESVVLCADAATQTGEDAPCDMQ